MIQEYNGAADERWREERACSLSTDVRSIRLIGGAERRQKADVNPQPR